jgi:hypothetical protein
MRCVIRLLCSANIPTHSAQWLAMTPERIIELRKMRRHLTDYFG